jgi:hypothetical protein
MYGSAERGTARRVLHDSHWKDHLVSSKLRLCFVAAASAVLVAATAAPATAGGVVDPAPIGPHNYFIGQVNNMTGPATIQMACFGPVVPGQTGHPLAGQTVKVLPVTPPTSSIVGYTGTAATSIVVTFTTPASTGTPIVLHDWAVSAPIPTTLVLPCSGTGQATFTPVPTSPTARPATVTVTFAGQP